MSHAEPGCELARDTGIDVNYLGQCSTGRLNYVSLAIRALSRLGRFATQLRAEDPGFDAFMHDSGFPPTKSAAKLCEGLHTYSLQLQILQDTISMASGCMRRNTACKAQS